MKQVGAEVDFQSWKWISLRYRRRFEFILLNAALCAIWISIYFAQYISSDHDHKPLVVFINGAVLVLICLHSIVLFLSICDSRLQVVIESNTQMEKRLVHTLVISLFLSSLLSVFIYRSETPQAMLDLNSSISAVILISPRLLHNLGYCQKEIFFFCGLNSIPWCILCFQCRANEFTIHFWIMLISAIFFVIMDIHIQESEYEHHFEALKFSILSKEKEKNFDFKDIIATVNTVVDMINQLEFDIRHRISRGLEYVNSNGYNNTDTEIVREKLLIDSLSLSTGIGEGVKSPFPIEISKRLVKSACKVGSASLKSHHIGYLYHIETLCEAISISLSSKDNTAFREDRDGSFYLSEMIENIFWAFEDTFLPRVVPLFFDSAFGDLYIQKTSRKCLETIVFLILYDSIYGETPGFCLVSFECHKHGGIGHSNTVELVITKSSNSSLTLRRQNSISDAHDDYASVTRDDDDGSTTKSTTKKMMREFPRSYSDAPQIILADRLAFQYLNTRVCGMGPEQNGQMSTHTWRVDISSVQTQQHDERIPLVCDLQDHLYQWKLFHDSSCSSTDLHIYQGFKNTLTKLGVAFTVGDIKEGIDNQYRRKKHKICVIHERILNQLKDTKLQLLISKAANVIVLVDVEITRRDASFFGVRQFTPNIRPQNGTTLGSACFERRTLPEAFCRLIRLQVYSNVTPADFITQFREFHVEPKYVQAFEQPPCATPPSQQTSSRTGDQDEMVYLKAVGVTISISSCWYQMLNDWKVDPNGYPRLLQMLQLCYGAVSGTRKVKRENPDCLHIQNIPHHNADDSPDGIASTILSHDDDEIAPKHTVRSNNTNTEQMNYDEQIIDSPCCLEKLRNITLQQPQQKEFEKLEKSFSELFVHACLTVHSIEKIVRHAKEDGVPATLPSVNNFSDTDMYKRNSITPIHKSLLTIVNNTAYGSSGGGIICSYLLTKYVKPLTKVRTLISMLENSEKQDGVTKAAIDSYFLTELNNGFYTLVDHCKRDELEFLHIWFSNIQALFADNLMKCRGEASKLVPMMLDIAENALWGISDSCSQRSRS